MCWWAIFPPQFAGIVSGVSAHLDATNRTDVLRVIDRGKVRQIPLNSVVVVILKNVSSYMYITVVNKIWSKLISILSKKNINCVHTVRTFCI